MYAHAAVNLASGVCVGDRHTVCGRWHPLTRAQRTEYWQGESTAVCSPPISRGKRRLRLSRTQSKKPAARNLATICGVSWSSGDAKGNAGPLTRNVAQPPARHRSPAKPRQLHEINLWHKVSVQFSAIKNLCAGRQAWPGAIRNVAANPEVRLICASSELKVHLQQRQRLCTVLPAASVQTATRREAPAPEAPFLIAWS